MASKAVERYCRVYRILDDNKCEIEIYLPNMETIRHLSGHMVDVLKKLDLYEQDKDFLWVERNTKYGMSVTFKPYVAKPNPKIEELYKMLEVGYYSDSTN